jgi:hypothetical protein
LANLCDHEDHRTARRDCLFLAGLGVPSNFVAVEADFLPEQMAIG